MSWHYLLAPAEESSVACCTGGEPLPPLKSKTTHAEFFCNGKLTESYLNSLSWTTCEPSTGSRGAERSMLSPEDSPARTSALPEREQGSPESGLAFGRTWRELSVRFDPPTRLWKTAHSLFPEDSTECLPTLPRSGMMRSGRCWELMMSERRTDESGYGYWPTPRAQESTESIESIESRKLKTGIAQMNLTAAVRTWPTPCATDHKGSGQTGELRDRLDYVVDRGGTKTRQTFPTPRAQDSYERRSIKTMQRIVETGGDVTLPTRIKTDAIRWATPKSSPSGPDNARKNRDGSGGDDLVTQVQGQLNPNWVEWLMGWPICWTSLEPLPAWSFPAWQQGHGIVSRD